MTQTVSCTGLAQACNYQAGLQLNTEKYRRETNIKFSRSVSYWPNFSSDEDNNGHEDDETPVITAPSVLTETLQ